MTTRIPWDKNEAALLLEWYLKVCSGDVLKKEAALEVSNILRKRAEQKGILLDDTFRNVNGIVMQFGNLEYILSSGQHGLKSGSKLFKEIVNLYKTNAEGFINFDNDIKCQVDYRMSEAEQRKSDIYEVLKNNFKYGMRVESPIELVRFRRFYQADLKIECGYDDEELKSKITECGILFEEKIYLLSENIITKINELIDDYRNESLSIIYFEEFYLVNEPFFSDNGVFSTDMLKAVIGAYIKNIKTKANYFLITEYVVTEAESLERDMLSIWGDECLHNYSELHDRMRYVSLEKIKYGLVSRKCFVWDSNETYTNVHKLKISEMQRNNIYKDVEQACNEKGYCSFQDIDMEEIFSENYEFTKNTVCSLVFEEVLSLEFNKNSKVVYSKRKDGKPVDWLYQYCKEKKQCSLQELLDQWELFAGNRRQDQTLNIGNSALVRVDEELFVDDSRIFFDTDVIDNLLSNIIRGEFIGMKEIISFALFPYYGFKWNYYLLESYCRRFSKKFKYLVWTYNSSNSGAIVKKESSMEYPDIMAQSVAESQIELTKKNVLDYLVKAGYLSRYRYKQIDNLILEAKEIREGRK